MREPAGPRLLRHPFLTLALLTAVAFATALPGEYCSDDAYTIRDNAAVSSLAGVKHLVGRGFGPAFGDLHYRPLAPLTWFIDGAVCGKRPACSRLISLIVHWAAAAALFTLWRRLFRGADLALLAAALFAVHPLNTEVANCAAFRKDVLALLLLAATLALALPSWRLAASAPLRGRAFRGLVLAAVLWWLGLLAKEPAFMAVALAPLAAAARWGGKGPQLVLAGLDHVRPKRRRRLVAAGAVAVLFLALAFAAWFALYEVFSYAGTGGGEWPGGRGPLLGVLNGFRTFAVYARLWLWPVGLSVAHPFEPSTSFADLRIWGAALVVAAWAVFALAALIASGPDSRLRIAGFGAAWALGSLAPAAQILPSPQMLAERYFHPAMPGLALALAAALAPPRRGAPWGARRRGAMMLIFGFWIGATLWRNLDWQDVTRLNIKCYRQWDNAAGDEALGALYVEASNLQLAERYARRAIERDPDRGGAHRILGVILIMRGRNPEARKHLSRALVLNPRDERARQALNLTDPPGKSGEITQEPSHSEGLMFREGEHPEGAPPSKTPRGSPASPANGSK